MTLSGYSIPEGTNIMVLLKFLLHFYFCDLFARSQYLSCIIYQNITMTRISSTHHDLILTKNSMSGIMHNKFYL